MRTGLLLSVLLSYIFLGCEKKIATPPSSQGSSSLNFRANVAIVYNGNLVVAGGNSIAQWNKRTEWTSLGSLSPNESISYLAEYNGSLIVGVGNEGAWSSNCLYRWNGSNWTPVTTQLKANPYRGNYPKIAALAVYNGKLIMAGTFDTIDNISANCIAQWDGNSWASMGTGFNLFYQPAAMIVYNGDLIEQDNYGNIKSWNGSTWDSIGVGSLMTVYNGNLLVSDSVIKQWNGSMWSNLGSVKMPIGSSTAFCVYNGNLTIANTYRNIVYPYMPPYWYDEGIQELNGSNWQIIGTSDSYGSAAPSPYEVYSMVSYNGNLVALGYYLVSNGEPTNVDGIASFDGSTWSAL